MTSEDRVFTIRLKMFDLYDRKEWTVLKICKLFGISRTCSTSSKGDEKIWETVALSPIPKEDHLSCKSDSFGRRISGAGFHSTVPHLWPLRE